MKRTIIHTSAAIALLLGIAACTQDEAGFLQEDLTGTLFHHSRQNSLGNDKRSIQVDVDYFTEISSFHYIAANVLKWHWWRFNGEGYFWGMTPGS